MGNFITYIIMEFSLHIFHHLSSILNPFFKINEAKKGDKGNIVLLHGWMARGLSLIILKKRLETLGYTVYAPDFGYNLKNIERLAGELDSYIKTNRIKNFILIGHSMGGLLGLYYYQNYKSKLKKLISLGCPFHGTEIARIAFFSESAKQMIPGSRFIKKLLKQNKYSDVYVIESTHDHITSTTSGYLSGAHNIKLEWIGHMSMVVSREVFREIEKILKNN